MINQECYAKLQEVELSILLLHTNKPKPQQQQSGSSLVDSQIDSTISKFNQITPDKLDLDYLDYYNEVRSSNFTLMDYAKYTNSISSASVSSSQFLNKNLGNGGGLSSVIESNRNTGYNRSGTPMSDSSGGLKSENTKKYRLQTLDDFLSDNTGRGAFGGDAEEEDEDDDDEEEDDDDDEGSEEEDSEDEEDEENGGDNEDYEYDDDSEDDEKGLLTGRA
ncbi:unnamed protein product [Ambrosiozyma monospora]|uniref:Unnamed protein product n=1 Tax=Ambrosiozyma monospora TaxID=43982 RepID=A0ACB5TWU6_AMBMO|nr:unnamed protein product [Ambrosiozyma monospora]